MLDDKSIEEMELMSHIDIAYKYLKENNKSLKTAELFRVISNLLEYTSDEYADKLGDFYTDINLDKRFVMLPDSTWDVRDRQVSTSVLEDELLEEELLEADDIIDDSDDAEKDLDEDLDEDLNDEESDNYEDYDSYNEDLEVDLDDELDEELNDEDFSDELEELSILDEDELE